ncbi:hypothetical protein OUZ56_002285 [Daphnia magna]|uniref:Uncharacterized protein n=1 Tax=Daphnia magna TaxID=35525 RepID=A0ABR0A5I1_9CRUS|nr:hypothetical protein OUZ56_002285 [Daphnia magna]
MYCIFVVIRVQQGSEKKIVKTNIEDIDEEANLRKCGIEATWASDVSWIISKEMFWQNKLMTSSCHSFLNDVYN